MKKSKKYIIIVLCCLLAILVSIKIFKVSPKTLKTDSGFDSSWDSGSDSSWDSSSNYGSSSGKIEIMGLAIITGALIIIILSLSIASKYRSKQIENTIGKEKLQQFLLDNNLKEEELLSNAYDIYVKIQNAWMNDTLDDVKSIISDEIYNQYDAQLTQLRIKKEQNIMGDFEKIDAFINDFNTIDNAIYINIVLIVKCKDYLINKTNNKVVRGNSKMINLYTYNLRFMLAKETIEKCPNCGALLPKDGSAVNCEYCNCKIVRLSKNMVLVDKKMIKQQ